MGKIRLYIDHRFDPGQPVPLDTDQSHYLSTVMRLSPGAEIAVFNGRQGEWTARLVQAGHPHPLLQRADGSVETLGRGGMPIGLLRDAVFEEVTLKLEPGDRLFITSDGITEASDPEGTLLDQEGLEAILRTNAFLRGTPMLESLCWSVAQFTRGERLDDISAVLIERDLG